MNKYYSVKYVIIVYLFINNGFSQLPVNINHPAQNIIKRLAITNQIPFKHFGNSSLSTLDAINHLKNRDEQLIKINSRNIQFPCRDTTSATYKSKKRIFKSSIDGTKKYFLQFMTDSSSFWLDWNENISTIFTDTKNNLQSSDQLSIHGIIKNKIFFFSNFSMNRLKANEDTEPFINYTGEWRKYFPENQTILWYTNHTSLYIKNALLDFEISNFPFNWGYSSKNSPSLSSQAVPLNRFSLYKKLNKINFEYFHASTMSSSIDEIHSKNVKPDKFIAGHRLQYEWNNNFHLSFSELVLYGNRSPEIAYLNPITFFWAQEHNLGDLDNVLMSFDIAWNIHPGVALYNTIFIDELSWKDLNTNWWGNKYAYQLGIFLTSKEFFIPDLRIEYTSIRPWTYTHSDFPFTNRNRSLGSSYGPNSKVISIESFYYPRNDIIIHFSTDFLKKGNGQGSNINDNYDLRNKDLDYDTDFFIDGFSYNVISKLKIKYHLSDFLQIDYDLHYDKKEYIVHSLKINANF